MPLKRHERLSRQIDIISKDEEQSVFQSATPAHFDGVPIVVATPLPALIVQDQLSLGEDLEVSAPLVTPLPQQADGSQLKKRAVVVTVTQTQELGTNAGGSGNSSNQTVPLGIIIGSIAVGVVIAIAVVGGWLWLSKRKKRSQKRHYRPPPRSYPTGSSNRPLIPNEKAYVSTPVKARTVDSAYHSKSAATPTKSLAFPVGDKSAKPHSNPVAAVGASSNSSLPTSSTSPPKKTFAPLKSSPLSEKKKAEPSNRGNEWANPIFAPTATDGHAGGNGLTVPGGADGDRRVSVASAESYYGDEDDGYGHAR